MKLTTVANASAEIGLSERTLYNMFEDGRLTKYQMKGGRAVRVDLDELHALFVPIEVESEVTA